MLNESFSESYKAAPRWQKAFVWIVLVVALVSGLAKTISAFRDSSAEKKDWTLTAVQGTDIAGAIDQFKMLVGHCPGIYKYKTDVESVEYIPDKTFKVTVTGKPSVMPAESYAMHHTCHFSVTADKATVGKRPCAWLCTGEDMSGVDGNDHSYAKGKIIGPLQRPWANLREAIAATRLDMADIQGAEISTGAALLAIWGANNMKWSELQAIPSGKYGMVMKEPDSQRGAKLCVNGQVIEIALDTTVPQKIYQGGLFDDDGRIYRFIAVGSTGEIVAGSQTRFCGIVTGQQHYPNSAGGVAHAVHLVGIFDLPENHQPPIGSASVNSTPNLAPNPTHTPTP